MREVEIYYDDTKLDLPDSEVIPITKQVNEVGDLNVFKSDFSQEFRIERTRAMNKLFENAELVRSESTAPYRALDVKVIAQGMEETELGTADNLDTFGQEDAGVAGKRHPGAMNVGCYDEALVQPD